MVKLNILSIYCINNYILLNFYLIFESSPPCEVLKRILPFSTKISTLISFNGLFASLQVLTKDSVTVSVDAVVYYRVNNATISIANVENAHHSTRLLAQTTLRNT